MLADVMLLTPKTKIVHPAPGNATGKLVDGILNWCKISTLCLSPQTLHETENDSGDEVGALDQDCNRGIGLGLCEASVCPGIVHRLDKGTSGLLVVAKNEHSHSHVAEQFKKHRIKKVYLSLTCGLPSPTSGCIAGFVNNRIRMIASPGSDTYGKKHHAMSSLKLTSMFNEKAGCHSSSQTSILDVNHSYILGKPHLYSRIENKDTEELNTEKLRIDCQDSPSVRGIAGLGGHSGFHSVLLHLLRKPTSASLQQVRQAHAQLLVTGLSYLPCHAFKVLSLYANNGYFTDAKILLHSQLKVDLLSFSTLINACSKFNDYRSTITLFSQMFLNGLLPDAHVLPSVIKACAGLLVFNIGKQVHGFSLASGISLNPFIESSLLHFYVKSDDLLSAQKLFDNMVEKEVVSWSALVAGYARKGEVFNATKVFNEVQYLGFQPNSVSWNGLIAGFNQSGSFLDAVLMFQQMHFKGFKSDGTSISSVLPAIGDLGYLSIGTQIHGYVIKMGFSVDNCIISALIDMYSKCGFILGMSRVFQDIVQMDAGTCNALIAGLSRHGRVDETLRIFIEMRDQELELNVVSWTSVIACCSQHGKDIEALELFRQMQGAGVKPNSVTISCLLPACGNIAALTHGKAAHCFSLKWGMSGDVFVGSAVIDMYSNCGKIKVARCCFDRMPVRNLVCWNAMLGAYAMHGKATEAIETFLWMQREGQKPDSISFTSLLSACSQSGLLDEGYHYFESMSKDHGVEARMEHYACMVSLLGRAGKLEEAYSFIKKIPFNPDACVWGAFLSSCRLHNNLSLAEVAAGKLFELEPGNPGNYILLSNIFASKRKWKEVDKIRDIMRDKGLRKNPGCSWIEVKNKVHMLLAGDKALPHMPQILDKLNRLSTEMKIAGYLPHTNFVLQDVEEQEKEHILCGHSEKLAVGFGLLNTSQGSPLRITKNLRICGDCHSFIKFVSKFEGREFFVRDTNRYHHFKDGDCSCGDYW